MKTVKGVRVLHSLRWLPAKGKSISKRNGGSTMKKLNQALTRLHSDLQLQAAGGNPNAGFLIDRLPETREVRKP